MLEKITAGWTSQAIAVAASLGLLDELEGGPLSASQLAERLTLACEPTERLLRFLVSEQLLSESADDTFALTKLGRVLLTDHPDSVRQIATLCGGEWHRAWGALQESVATGRCAFERIHGKPYFDYLADHPALQQTFSAGMRQVSSMTDLPVALAYDFSRFLRVMDVGGGAGSQLTTLLGLYPKLEGVLFDVQGVIDDAAPHLKTTPVGGRLALVPGDFRVDVPGGADAYLLKTVLHDWSDDEVVAILRRCARHMGPKDRLLIAEHVLLPGARPQFGKRLDLMMMVVLGGKERTRAQYAALLARAGLALVGEYPTVAELTLLEAVAA